MWMWCIGIEAVDRWWWANRMAIEHYDTTPTIITPFVMVALVKPSLVPPMHGLFTPKCPVQGHHHEQILRTLVLFIAPSTKNPTHVSFMGTWMFILWIVYLFIYLFRDFFNKYTAMLLLCMGPASCHQYPTVFQGILQPSKLRPCILPFVSVGFYFLFFILKSFFTVVLKNKNTFFWR